MSTPSAPPPEILRPNPAFLCPPKFDRERPLERIRQMAESMRDIGQLQPIRIRKDGDKYRVVAGETRRQGALFLGWTEIAAILVADDLSESDELIETFEENNTREGWAILQRAEVYLRLMALNGWTAKQVALHTHSSQSDVAKAVLVSKQFPQEYREALFTGRISATAAYQISRAPEASQRLRLCERVVAGELTRDQVEAEVTQLLAAQKGTARKEKPVTLDVDGVKLTYSSLDNLAGVFAKLLPVVKSLLAKNAKALPTDLPVFMRLQS